AQTALLEVVEKQLPAAPLEVLLLGEFSAVMTAALQTRGYRLTNVRWREPQHQVLPPAGARGELLQVQLKSAATAGRHFDAVLALDFAADIHPLALFDGLHAVLAPQGVALLAGQRGPAGWMDYLPALVTRCGFALDAPSAEAGALFFMHVLRRAVTPPRWRVGHVLPTDFDDLATLFLDVFGHPLSRALWDWKYGASRGNAVLVRSEGQVVAHYGGIYRDILRCGMPDRVAQIGDVMVQSRERGVLTRNGPFFLIGTSWPEVYGPRGFGFPNERAMRVAEKMGLYTRAGHMAQVRWLPSPPRVRLQTRVRLLARGNAADGAQVAPLWAAMVHDLRESVVGVRDWAYLERRYFSHPHNHYEVLLVSTRLSGKPLGVVVLRRLEDACELLDVIAPLANFATVIDQARRLTGRWGLPSLYAWITSQHVPLLVACGGTEEPLNVLIPASSWTADPQSELFVGKWWLMSGDTDFR
ncbi:MAG: hypothetical protein ABI845_03190, partial [Polaromonas sp.]